MKKIRKTAVAAVLCAAMVLMTGVVSVSAADNTAETEPTEIILENSDAPMQTQAQAAPELKPGEKPAIELIDSKMDGDTYVGGYQVIQEDVAKQSKLLVNGASKIVISASNNRENMQSLEAWADNACAMLKVKNITSACDTYFSDPVKTEICGFDAIVYNYDILQYQFLEDNVTKEHIDTFKGRNYYIYSDENAYVLMFDTNDETWDEQLKCFEKFVGSLVIEGKSNSALSFEEIVILCASAAIGIVGAVTVLVMNKNKKKAE